MIGYAIVRILWWYVFDILAERILGVRYVILNHLAPLRHDVCLFGADLNKGKYHTGDEHEQQNDAVDAMQRLALEKQSEE